MPSRKSSSRRVPRTAQLKTLTLGWKLLSIFPKGALTRISRDHVDKYYFGEELEKLYKPGEVRI